MYTITIRRQRKLVFGALTIQILIDGVTLGKVRNGETVEIEVPDGDHELDAWMPPFVHGRPIQIYEDGRDRFVVIPVMGILGNSVRFE
jgi:hypothetical protein